MTDLKNLPSYCDAVVLSYPKDGVFRRLKEMGLAAGAVVKKLRQAPFNGPVELMLSGAAVMIRAFDAEKIKVEEIK